ncbi:MAG: hypothetical protein II669_00090, partial [Elusimicrobia bacterium]|nr:hypothetical protein [Elusimicrobiota bacterium]
GNKTLTENDLAEIFNDETINKIKELLENNKANGFDLTMTVREYILGSMMATIEKDIISSDVQVGEKNYKILAGAALLMMVNGESLDKVRETLDGNGIVIDGSGSLSQLLNNMQDSKYARVANGILGMWEASNMMIKLEGEQVNKEADFATLTGLIKLILTMDTILPEKGLLDSSMNVSLDGIKGILAAA